MQYRQIEMSKGLVMGIDAGGSKIRSLVKDGADHVVYTGVGGPGNWASTERDHLVFSLSQAVASSPDVERVAVCMAGILTADDREGCATLVRRITRCNDVSVFPDFAAAAAAHPGASCVVIAGTGSIICSVTPNGLIKSGGGGPLLGDIGSGFDIVRRALQTLLQPNATIPSTRLAQKCKELFGSAEPADIVRGIYRQNRPPQAIASLLPEIFEDQRHRFGFATHAIQSALSDLAGQVGAHLLSLGVRSGAVVAVTGGVFQNEFALQSFQQCLDSLRAPKNCSVVNLMMSPADGAVRIARMGVVC